MTITATIIDVQPDTRYQGTTYEHRVVLNVRGTTFGVFDPDMHADPSMIGETREVEIFPFIPTKVVMSSDSTPQVIPYKNDPKEYSKHTFCGQIDEISQEWPKWMTVDIGSGTVRIKFYRDPPPHIQYKETIEAATVGEMICVTVSRVDLREIK